MENRERYKRLIMFLASAVIIAIETLLSYIWYKFYAHKEVIGRRFDRGNQVVIGLYVLDDILLYKILVVLRWVICGYLK